MDGDHAGRDPQWLSAVPTEAYHWIISLPSKAPALCNKSSASVLFLGDVALAHGVAQMIDRNGPAFSFGRVPPEFLDADVVCFNLECCLSDRGETWEPKPVLLKGAPRYLSIFPRSGQRYVANVANNHFLDYGQDAAADTLRALRDNNMAYFGATGVAANGQPLTLQTRGGALALLGFAPCAHPLPGSTHINVATGRGTDLAGTVSQAKRNADVVIVSVHQGLEYSRYVLPACRKLARHLVAAGADCVICHHGHVIQPLEVHGHSLVFHGIGNFLIDVDSRRRPDAALTLALRVHLNSGRICHVSVEPFAVSQLLQPYPLVGRDGDGLRERFARLSESLSSPAGSFRNNLSARAAWLADRLLAVSATIRRAGMPEAMAYYCRRLMKPR